ncbi:MAG: mercury resistance system transport protein MerF [Nitrospirota bacterium]
MHTVTGDRSHGAAHAASTERTRADRLVKVGMIGSVVAAVCCVTPLLVIGLTAVGLGAMAGGLDAVLVPSLLVCVAVLAYGLYLRRKVRAVCCGREASPEEVSHERAERH